ncbi:Hypothetical protein NRBB56_0456 [Bifidobacterium breve]|nr:Hypothetical protein NRBB56_0456 [Bifidobacterium breve]
MPRRGCASRALAWACCRFRRWSPAVRVPWRGRWACVWAGGGGSCRSCSRCRRAATSCTGRRNTWPCPVRRAARRAGRARCRRHASLRCGRRPGEHGLLRRERGGAEGHVLPADRGRMPSRHHGYAAHARPVAHLNPDDLPFLFRQVRIHLAQGATPLRLAIRTISNLTGAALSIRQRASHHAVIMLL